MQHGYLAADQLQVCIRAFIPKNHSSCSRLAPEQRSNRAKHYERDTHESSQTARNQLLSERLTTRCRPPFIKARTDRAAAPIDVSESSGRSWRHDGPTARFFNRGLFFRRINDLSQRRYAHHGAMTMHAAVMRIDLASYPPALANANEAISMMDNNANPNRFNGLPFR